MEYQPIIHLLKLLLLIVLVAAMPSDASHSDDLRPVAYEEPWDKFCRQLDAQTDCQSTELPDEIKIAIVLKSGFGEFNLFSIDFDRRVADTVSLLNRVQYERNYGYCEMYRVWFKPNEPPLTIVDDIVTLFESANIPDPFIIDSRLKIIINNEIFTETNLLIEIKVGESRSNVREFIVQPTQGNGLDDTSGPQPVYYTAYDQKSQYETAEFVDPLIVSHSTYQFQDLVLDFHRDILVKGVLIITSSTIENHTDWELSYFIEGSNSVLTECSPEVAGYNFDEDETDQFKQKGAAFNCKITGQKFIIRVQGSGLNSDFDIKSLFTSIRIWTEEIISIDANYLLPFGSTSQNTDTQIQSLYRAGSINKRDDQVVVNSANEFFPVLVLDLQKVCIVTQVLVIFYDQFNVSPEEYNVRITNDQITAITELLNDENYGFSMEQSQPLTFVSRQINAEQIDNTLGGQYVTLFRTTNNSDLRIAKIVVVGTPVQECLNTNNCAVDKAFDGCDTYDATYEHNCGEFDNTSFNAAKMCCHCNGGITREPATGADLNGKEACENRGYSESECLAVGCCEWEQTDQWCRSTVGEGVCPTTCLESDPPDDDDQGDSGPPDDGGDSGPPVDGGDSGPPDDGGDSGPPVDGENSGDNSGDDPPDIVMPDSDKDTLSVFQRAEQMLNSDFGYGIHRAEIGGDSVEINLSLLLEMNDNTDFGAPLELNADLKGAASFIVLDRSQARMIISPQEEEQEADYKLLMTLKDGTQQFEKTVLLRVEPQGQSQAGPVNPPDTHQQSPINILRGSTYTLNIRDHVSLGGGTTIHDVDLLEIEPFSDFDGNQTITLTPDNSTRLGLYPFIVEVLHAAGATEQFQIEIGVVDNPNQAVNTIVQEFAANSGTITDILQSDGSLELEVGERQVLLDYHIHELQTDNGEDEEEDRDEPEMVVGQITSTGGLMLYFNTNIVGPTILSNSNIGLSTQGGLSTAISSQDTRRLQVVNTQTFDLANYLLFEIERGDQDSADGKDLAFTVTSEQISNDRLNLRLKFENPMKVSIGTKKDILIIIIKDDQFFNSQSGLSGQNLKNGSTIRNLLPRMVPGDDLVLEFAESSISTATQAIVVTQLVITITMAVSLKAVWNLMNIVQVLAYIRFYTEWPQRMMLVFEYADNAITLRPISQPIFNYGKTKFEIANSTLANEDLLGLGVQDASLTQSLGVFLLAAVAIGLLILLYFIIKCCRKIQNPTLKQIQQKLEDKLFYNSFLRYMLVSNLKLTYTLWAFFVAFFSYDTVQESIQTTAFMMTILFLMVWPIFIARLMFKNKKVLMHKSVFKKYSTLYQEIRTDSKEALLYNVMFCVRRFDIVVINVFFSQNALLTNFDNNHYLFKIFCFLLIQSIYVIYILYAKPHVSGAYNWLEIFNETLLIVLSFIMICYCGIGDRHLKTEIQEAAFPEVVSLIIIAIIVVINVFVMVKLTILKMISTYKQKKQLEKHQQAKQIAQSEPATPVTTFRSNLRSDSSNHQPASTPLVNNINLDDDQFRKGPYEPGQTFLLPHVGHVDKEQILNSSRGMEVVREQVSEEDKCQNGEDSSSSSNSDDSFYRPNQNMEPSRYASTDIVVSSILIKYDAPPGPNALEMPKGTDTKGFDSRNSSLSDLYEQSAQENKAQNSIRHTFEQHEEMKCSKAMKKYAHKADDEISSDQLY